MPNLELSGKHLAQLKQQGISVDELQRQLERFRTGMLYVDLVRPARVGDGILRFNETEADHYIDHFKKSAGCHLMIRFIPASGAATRMFKDLFAFIDSADSPEASFNDLSPSVRYFAENLASFPFYNELEVRTRQHYPDITCHTDTGALLKYTRMLLLKEGMNYGALPKALLTFHKYGNEARMPFEEHLVEWAWFTAEAGNRSINLHFTLSQQHVQPFHDELEKRLPIYRERFGRDFHISCSVQEASTDTIAANEYNEPLLDSTGNLLFRPGGHGALLFNLNTLDADIISIKNIDNVAVEKVEILNLRWKMLLTGLLLSIREKIHIILNELDQGTPDQEKLAEMTGFVSHTFGRQFNPVDPEVIAEIRDYLNRPLRVCGMVPNTGEPGGGPFWIRNADGVSLQIIESAQIDLSDPVQKKIASEATHFNPVDIVCAVRDYKGNKFNLKDFADPDTSFISVKSHQGKILKALEHPGLWNGGMAKWLTLFVEVPLITFNPVKTVNDLLRHEHRNEGKRQ